MKDLGPMMLRRQLGKQLRNLREAAGLRMEDAAAELDCVRSRISQLETGRYGVRKPDLEALLRLYGALDRLEVLEELRRESGKRGWWSTYKLPEWLQGYIGLEDDAVAIRTFSLEMIPGLLQTEAYARAVHIGPPPPKDIDRRVAVRVQRQARLETADSPVLTAVISEAGLMRTLALGGVGIRQLEHLTTRSSELPNVSVQVLPFAAGVHPSMSGSFTVLDFAPGVSSSIGYQEYAMGGHLVDDLDDVQSMSDLHDQLRGQALGSDESLTMISELTQRTR